VVNSTPWPVWAGAENLAPTGIRSLDHHLAASRHIDYAALAHIKAGNQAKKKLSFCFTYHYPLSILDKQEPSIPDFAVQSCLFFIRIFQDKRC